MGGVAAVFSKSGIDAPGLVVKMLYAMQHRAQDGAAVAWDTNFESARSPSRLSVSSSIQQTAVGYALTKILPSDSLQPVRAGDGWLCLDGRVVGNRTLVGGEEAAQLLENKLTPAELSLIQRDTDGAYSLCFCTTNQLLVTRDQLGLKSLFIGNRDGLVAVASERKALWAIGIRDAASFPPGGCLKASSDSSVVEFPSRQMPKASSRRYEEVDAEELSQLLIESVQVHTAGLGPISAGFSGGLDSTVLAKIAVDAGVDLLLVTVGAGRTLETRLAESAAQSIGLRIAAKQLSTDDVEECLDRVLWLIEEPNLMKVSVAMAMHWTAKAALENGRHVIMLGQGSDELFGGYKRFATILGERGPEGSVEAISESIRDAYELNYQRDEQAVSSLRVELRLPFATRKIVEFASAVPLRMKVRSPTDNLRKWILRDAAIKLGVPSAIALRPKKAIQHASGIEKAIREIARKHGLSTLDYLEDRFGALKNGHVAGHAE